MNAAAVRAGGKPALARALSLIEADLYGEPATALLDDAFQQPFGAIIGLTGPPGVGKSTLTNVLIRRFREADKTVGVIAVDPSSTLTGGALLGDRTRLSTDPGDDGIFVRSMAARDRLGGLSDHAIAGAILMQAVHDRVIVESVGIGQSEADIARLADLTVLCIQPGSGDSLQFMKAGIMEVPDIVVVTKADMGDAARRAVADVEGALSLSGVKVPVIALSSTTGEGVKRLTETIADMLAQVEKRASEIRKTRARHWVRDGIKTHLGTDGLERFDRLPPNESNAPFSALREALAELRRDIR